MVRRRRLAFTLIEMLVVVLLSSVVLGFVANFYLDVSVASRAALDKSRDVRRASTVLDRVTRDLEAAVLVKKPADLDPLEHPWLFLGEASGRGEGSDRIKFDARNHRPRAGAGHESDLVVIAYWLAPSEDGDSLDLLRWVSPRLPEALDRTFPRRDDPGVEVLASGVASFGVRFQDEAGNLSDTWDSSQLVDTSELPLAALVTLSFAPETVEGVPLEQTEQAPPLYQRPVLIAQRPLDLEKALADEAEQGAENKDLDCVTVSQCVARNQDLVDQYVEEHPDFEQILRSIGDQCVKNHELPIAVANCE